MKTNSSNDCLIMSKVNDSCIEGYELTKIQDAPLYD